MSNLKSTNDLILIGWIPTDQKGDPYTATVSNEGKGGGGKGSTIKATRKFYATEKRAAAYSPAKKSKPIYMEP